MSKIKRILSVIHYTIYGAVLFQFPHFPCDYWERAHTHTHTHARTHTLCLIIIIKSKVWAIIQCLWLGHETTVCVVCLSIFLRTWTTWSRSCLNYSLISTRYDKCVLFHNILIHISNIYFRAMPNICWMSHWPWIDTTSNNAYDHGQGAVSIRKTVLPGMAIPMLKIRRPNGRLIFNMEIAIRR